MLIYVSKRGPEILLIISIGLSYYLNQQWQNIIFDPNYSKSACYNINAMGAHGCF